jgi:glutathione S-transferase
VVTLNEKKVAFDIDYIDLQNKPAWFLELSPTAKVPTLEVTTDDGERVVLFESVVINEYLDEATEGQMLPEEPLARARARAWIEYSNAVLSDVFALTSAKDHASLAGVQAKLASKLDRLEAEIGEGPFFLGSAISLVDAAFVPALQRLFWSNDLHAGLGIFANRPKMKRWWEALAARDSVKDSAVSDLRTQFEQMVGRDRGGYRSAIGRHVVQGAQAPS